MPSENIMYSEKYYDDKYEYRHVILPLDIAKSVPKGHLMTETEWRNLGVQQSPGWIHYMNHSPDHIWVIPDLKPGFGPYFKARPAIRIRDVFESGPLEPHVLLFRRLRPPKEIN